MVFFRHGTSTVTDMQNDQRTPDDDPRLPDDVENDRRAEKPLLEELPPGGEDGDEHGG
jgi:hypothetical protein